MLEFCLVLVLLLPGKAEPQELVIPADDCQKKAQEVAPIINTAGLLVLSASCQRST